MPLLVALGALPSLPTILTSYFQMDDFALIQLFYFMPFTDLLKLFASPMTQTIWKVPYNELRPVFALSYKLDLLIWDLNPVGFHATNVAIHVLNSLLVFSLGLKLLDGRGPAFLAAALFALAPVHAEALSWVSGRVDLLPALFYLGSFLCFVHFLGSGLWRNYLASLLLFGIGLFAKESVTVLPLAVSGYFLCYRRSEFGRAWRKSLVLLSPFFIVLAGYVALRVAVFGNPLRYIATWEAVDASQLVDFLVRQPVSLGHLLLPLRLFKPDVPAGISVAVLVVAAPVAVLLLIWCLLAWRERRSGAGLFRDLLFLGAVWYLVAVLPAILARYWSSRHLYVASAGFYLALVALLMAFQRGPWERWRNLSRAVLLGLLVLYGSSLTLLNWEWARAGQLSRKMHRGIEEQARTLPEGSTILLARGPFAMPPFAGGPPLPWLYAMPYALQPPLSDVALHYQVIERSDFYCCPNWWQDRGPQLEKALLGGDSPLYVFYWDERKNELAISQVSKEQLRRTFQEVLERPFGAGPLSETEALRLLDSLNTLAHQRFGGL